MPHKPQCLQTGGFVGECFGSTFRPKPGRLECLKKLVLWSDRRPAPSTQKPNRASNRVFFFLGFGFFGCLCLGTAAAAAPVPTSAVSPPFRFCPCCASASSCAPATCVAPPGCGGGGGGSPPPAAPRSAGTPSRGAPPGPGSGAGAAAPTLARAASSAALGRRPLAEAAGLCCPSKELGIVGRSATSSNATAAGSALMPGCREDRGETVSAQSTRQMWTVLRHGGPNRLTWSTQYRCLATCTSASNGAGHPSHFTLNVLPSSAAAVTLHM